LKGSVIPSTRETVTAASAAEPPCLRIANPAAVDSRLPETTTPPCEIARTAAGAVCEKTRKLESAAEYRQKMGFRD
jgi:hypothetical protein